MAETDNPKNTRLLAMVVGTVAALIVVVLAIIQYFDMSVRTEVYEKVLSQPNSVLRDLRAMETDKLSRYAWVDQKAGVVRIPVERAAELTVRDWDKRPAGLVKVEDVAPAPAAPAPGGAAPAAPAAPAPAGAAPAAPAPAASSQPAGGTPAPGTPQAPSTAPTPAPSTQPTGAAPPPAPTPAQPPK
jgi:hypothetical protein